MKSLGMIETRGLIGAIESADAMLKAAEVKLLDRTFVKGGIVTITVTGDVAAVKAAVDAGVAAVERLGNNLLLSCHVIPRPHEEVASKIVTAISALENQEELADEIEEIEEIKKIEEIEEKIEVAPSDDKVETVVVVEVEKKANAKKTDIATTQEEFNKIIERIGKESAIEILNTYKVTELRNLARKMDKFSIQGREISSAGKEKLINAFAKYYV